jgi:hypothetical protein
MYRTWKSYTPTVKKMKSAPLSLSPWQQHILLRLALWIITADRSTEPHISAMNISMRGGDLTSAFRFRPQNRLKHQTPLRQQPHPMRDMTNECNIFVRKSKTENINDIVVKKLNSREQINAWNFLIGKAHICIKYFGRRNLQEDGNS